MQDTPAVAKLRELHAASVAWTGDKRPRREGPKWERLKSAQLEAGSVLQAITNAQQALTDLGAR